MATCVVSGTFLDSKGTAINGATVRFNLDNPAIDSSGSLMVPREVTTTTASDGTWSLSLVQDTSGSLTLDLNPSSLSPLVKYKFSLVMPTSSTAPFASCWADSSSFGGQSVSSPIYFSNIAGQLATNQLPTLASGYMWVGNASGAATAVTTSGDGTISNAGVIAIATVGGSSAANLHTGELLANAATSTNTASATVKRDASGNFSAGTISAALSGNATTATTAGSFSGSLIGDVTGTQAATHVVAIQGYDVANTTPTNAQLQVYSTADNKYHPVSLSGDVTSTNAGVTSVGSVGGSSAANVHAAELLANAATAVNTASTIVKRDGSGQVAATTFTGALAGNATTATSATSATTATNATNVATTQVSNSASYFPLMVSSSTNGNQAADLGTGLTFNPSTNVLSTTTFNGALTGNATTATTGTNATNTAITDDTTTNATMYPTWVTASTGNLPQKTTSSKLTFNPSTGSLAATTVVAALTGTASGNLQATANNHGVLLSGSANTATVLAPDASATKVLKSGGASADPSWLAYDNANTASTLVARDASGNFSAGTVTAALTGAASGNTTYSANQYGVVLSGSGNAMTVLAPDSSTTKILTSGGTGAPPTWTTAPSGGVGINYLSTNPDAEVDTTGWATYADAAQNTPVDGTGGSPSSTWTRTTSTPLKGVGAFLWTRTANNRQGEGVSYAFTIDNGQQSSVLGITFDYKVVSGTFFAADGTTAPLNDGTVTQNAGMSDLEVFVYDVTNSVLIPVSPQVLTSTSATSAHFKGVFQTASNSTSYRFILHIARSTAVAFTAQFDNFTVGPQSVSYGPPVTDLNTNLTFTPASAAFGTISASRFENYRSSDHLFVNGGWTNGTTAASPAKIALPFPIDSSKLTGTASIRKLGTWHQRTSASNTIPGTNVTGVVFYDGSDTANAYLGATVSSVAYVKTNGSATNTSEGVSVDFCYPVAGWSSTLQMSNDTDTRVVAASYNTSAGQAITNGSDVIVNYDNKLLDTHAAVATGASWKYTAPVSGNYEVSAVDELASAAYTAASYIWLKVYKNGVNYGDLDLNRIEVSATTTHSAKGTIIVPMIAGDYIDVRAAHGESSSKNLNSRSTTNRIDIKRISGPSAVAATETVSARYYASGTSISSSLATISWTTKDWDSHGAMSSGTYTCPTAGKYQVNYSLALSGTLVLNNTTVAQIQKNGVAVNDTTHYIAGAITNDQISNSDIVPCLAGDTIRLQVSNSGTGPAIVSSNTKNWISLVRVGN